MACALRDNLVLPLQKQKESRKDVPFASNHTMYCAEYQQLEHAYAEAVRRWSQYASPQTIVAPGIDQLQRATALRQDALTERNSAANTLHLHRHQCLVCKG
jgi:hypothetical protein